MTDTSLPPLIDTHAHLDHHRFDADRAEVIDAARAGGVIKTLTVGCDLPSSAAAVALAAQHEELFAAVGIHPHDAASFDAAALQQLRQLAGQEKVVAIGEIGLDYYWNHAPAEVQQAAFRTQIGLARELKLPIIVHDRDAHDDVLRILREERASEVGGVLHCFSGDLQLARQCVELGFLISFAGNITFPGNEYLREVIRGLPVDQLLVETDCPYLAPHPQRGKRCEPALVRYTANAIATLKGLTEADVARVTTLNAERLFGLDGKMPPAEIAYVIRNSLYLNVTNRCSNGCIFCAKFTDAVVKGHYLRLEHEPSVEEVMTAIGDPTKYDEVVFCGYGEPLLRLELVKAVAQRLKARGVKVRINTDGQANLVHGRNVLPELAGLVDAVSVSLNAADAATYQRLCRTPFGEAGFAAVQEFLRQAPAAIPDVTASAVTYPGIDIDACRRLAASLGVKFRARDYNEVG